MSGHSKWSTIKHKKGALDAKRGKIFTRILKEIAVAAKMGGGDVSANPRLRLAVDLAKSNNMPKDTWERAIKKGTGELEGVTYEEVTYEGYGPGGVAILVEALTDNKNRTTPEIRSYFTKFGSELGAYNSVAHMFAKQGQIVVSEEELENKVMEVAIEAGADDVQFDNAWIITTNPVNYQTIKDAVSNAKLPIIESRIIKTAANEITVGGDKLKSLLKLIDLLEDNDDVQNVWHNAIYDSDEQ